MYHNEHTLKNLIQRVGFNLIEILNFSYPFEDSLITIVRNEAHTSNLEEEYVPELIQIGNTYASMFNQTKDKVNNTLYDFRKAGKKIAIFGAGHLAVKYINFFQLEDLISAVIDDNPYKTGLLMPGSKFKIIPSSYLFSSHIDLCLLSMSSESEAKVMDKNRSFIKNGGKFKSIFQLSNISII